MRRVVVDGFTCDLNDSDESCVRFIIAEHDEKMTSGYVKWDGCMEFDGGIHLCGPFNVRRFCALIEEIHREAGRMMPPPCEITADWKSVAAQENDE